MKYENIDMKLRGRWIKHTLQFTFSAGTSRGFLTERPTYIIVIEDDQGVRGIGESSPLRGLSPDDRPDFEQQLHRVVEKVAKIPPPNTPDDVDHWLQQHIPEDHPALRFGLETAWLDYLQGGQRQIYPHIFQTDAFPPIPINGLVWMGNREFMLRQIEEKIARGFRCIKLKIGAIDFDTELSLLAHIREHFSSDQIILRVDANGAFTTGNVMDKLRALSAYDLHSIEQPIAPQQTEFLRELCQHSPVPIALDEELIGVHHPEARKTLLDTIRPQCIVLKPTLLGGLAATAQWIHLAEQMGISWWLTSALESNIGLNAIAQFCASRQVAQPQGLGTGQLYHNNIPSPITIHNGFLHYDGSKPWDFSLLGL